MEGPNTRLDKSNIALAEQLKIEDMSLVSNCAHSVRVQ